MVDDAVLAALDVGVVVVVVVVVIDVGLLSVEDNKEARLYNSERSPIGSDENERE